MIFTLWEKPNFLRQISQFSDQQNEADSRRLYFFTTASILDFKAKKNVLHGAKDTFWLFP